MELSTEGFGRKDIGSGGGEKLGRGERHSRGGTAGPKTKCGGGWSTHGGRRAESNKPEVRGGECCEGLKCRGGRVHLFVHIFTSL